MKRVYAIMVTGGEPFELQIKGNLPLEHEGKTSLFHPVLPKGEVEPLLEALREFGGLVESNLTEETDEQREIRDRILGKVVLPCVQCADCRHYNPTWGDTLCERDMEPESETECSKFEATVMTDLG